MYMAHTRLFAINFAYRLSIFVNNVRNNRTVLRSAHQDPCFTASANAAVANCCTCSSGLLLFHLRDRHARIDVAGMETEATNGRCSSGRGGALLQIEMRFSRSSDNVETKTCVILSVTTTAVILVLSKGFFFSLRYCVRLSGIV